MSWRSIANWTLAVLIATCGCPHAQTRHHRRRRSRTRPAPCCPASRSKRRARRSSKRSGPRRPTARANTRSSTCGPGTYSVTFTLTGFNTVKREGIELSAGFTATWRSQTARRRPGGDHHRLRRSPLVDVQNTRQQTVMTREVIDSIPTGKTAAELRRPRAGRHRRHAGSGPTAQDVGGSVGDRQVAL